jgi:hypothetical protein
VNVTGRKDQWIPWKSLQFEKQKGTKNMNKQLKAERDLIASDTTLARLDAIAKTRKLTPGEVYEGRARLAAIACIPMRLGAVPIGETATARASDPLRTIMTRDNWWEDVARLDDYQPDLLAKPGSRIVAPRQEKKTKPKRSFAMDSASDKKISELMPCGGEIARDWLSGLGVRIDFGKPYQRRWNVYELLQSLVKKLPMHARARELDQRAIRNFLTLMLQMKGEA